MTRKPRQIEIDVGTPKVDLGKRLIDLTAADLVEIIDARLCAFLESEPRRAKDDQLLDRTAAARFLNVSTSKLDHLCKEATNRPPFMRVGDVRRFDREQLRAWATGKPDPAR